LITGTAADPVAACRAYEELLRRADSMQRDSRPQKKSSCTASPEALEYAHRYTSQVTLASFGEWDYTGALRRVAAPLLVIYGDRDPSPLSSQRAWAQAVPHGRLLVDDFLSGRWPEETVTKTRDGQR
jgi:pimeloyl-ACP methyl ester carboxylesterase